MSVSSLLRSKAHDLSSVDAYQRKTFALKTKCSFCDDCFLSLFRIILQASRENIKPYGSYCVQFYLNSKFREGFHISIVTQNNIGRFWWVDGFWESLTDALLWEKIKIIKPYLCFEHIVYSLKLTKTFDTRWSNVYRSAIQCLRK